jgi:hypothetical protein
MAAEVAFYRQCSLARDVPGGTEHTTSWLPDVRGYCTPGGVLRLRSARGVWTGGWRVVSASDPLPARVVEGMNKFRRSFSTVLDDDGCW